MDAAKYNAALQTLMKVAHIDVVETEEDWIQHLQHHALWGMGRAKKKVPRLPCLVWAEKHTDPQGIPNFVPWVTHWCFHVDGTFSSVNT